MSGTDANSLRTVTGTAASTLSIGSPRYVVVSFVASPADVELDREISLVMTVSNTGRFVLAGAGPGPLAVDGDGAVVRLTGPVPAPVAALGPGESASFSWMFRSTRGGIVTFRDTAVAAGITTPEATANPVSIAESAGSLRDAIVYPTPFDPDAALMGGLKFRRMPAFTEVGIYTTSGNLVRTVKGDHIGLAIWNGRNDSGSRVAPGVYFWVMKAPAGGLRRGKFEVSR